MQDSLRRQTQLEETDSKPQFKDIQPLQEDELEQSTIVQILFPAEPPVFCEFDWELDELEEFADNLVKEDLAEDQKDAFKDFVKEKVREAKKANREAREARKKALQEMSDETKAAFQNMKFYKFYPVPTPDSPDCWSIPFLTLSSLTLRTYPSNIPPSISSPSPLSTSSTPPSTTHQVSNLPNISFPVLANCNLHLRSKFLATMDLLFCNPPHLWLSHHCSFTATCAPLAASHHASSHLVVHDQQRVDSQNTMSELAISTIVGTLTVAALSGTLAIAHLTL
ncbi:hypothetical protein Acr_09g0006150 [Actinidia rufa]|uniref:Transmembrane protein n=1 Tax=Actinidia rufa TaxID=165716 RepID=A0A7J0F7G1_9ERIC|nr:hypothetical protein Acr_09g0006150 [Actinidia rufa]